MKIDAKTVSAIAATLVSASSLFAGELLLPAKEAVIHGTAQHGSNAIVGWNNPNTTVSWHVKVERGEEVEVVVDQAARTAMERRYRLMPYIYTLFREASVNGQPVMRPVFFADPANAALRKEDQAFLLGGDLLVIPKWAKNPAIPAGFNQSISLVGEDTVGDKYQCDLKIRDGAIVPLTKVMQNTTEFDHNDVTLMVRLNADGKAEGVLYEDANDGFGYHDGAFRLTRFNAERKDDRIVITQQITDGKMEPLDRNIAIEIILDDSVSRYTLKSTEKMTIKTTGNAG